MLPYCRLAHNKHISVKSSLKFKSFLFKKLHFEISSAKWRPFCLDLNVLRSIGNQPLNLLSLNIPVAGLGSSFIDSTLSLATLIARFMGPTWGPSGADRTQVGSMLAPCYLNTVAEYNDLWLSVTFSLTSGFIIFPGFIVADRVKLPRIVYA